MLAELGLQERIEGTGCTRMQRIRVYGLRNKTISLWYQTGETLGSKSESAPTSRMFTTMSH